MIDETLEMRAVELVAMARKEGIIKNKEDEIKNLRDHKLLTKEKIKDSMLSIQNVSDIKLKSEISISESDVTEIEKILKQNIIANLEEARLI